MSDRNAPLVGSILHPTDFSPASEHAFAHALAIALLRHTELTLLHVTASGEDVDWTAFPPVRRTMERWGILPAGSPRAAVFERFGARVRKVALRGHSPAMVTADYLERHPHDLLVLATRGAEGLERLVRPSRAEAIATRARTMTLYVPAGASRGLVDLQDGELDLRRILVPVDAAPDPTGAVHFARRAAQVLGLGAVEITLLHAGRAMPSLPPLEDDADCSWHTRLVHAESALAAIMRAAGGLPADLIVMATAAGEGLAGAVRGSTVHQVVRQARCPVLAVPAATAADA